MKRMFLIIPFIAITANAEMMGEGDTGRFISEKDRSEMKKLIASEKIEREVKKQKFEAEHKVKEAEIEKKEPSVKKEVAKIPVEDTSMEIIEEDTTTTKKEEEYVPFDASALTSTDGLLPQQELKPEKEEALKTEKAGEDDLAIGEELKEETNKIVLKQYNIRYDKEAEAYAYANPTKEEFNRYLRTHKITPSMLKTMLGSDANVNTVKLSALYYDFFLNRPDYAENFYKILYKKKSALKLYDVLFLADYILRTGRGDKLHAVIDRVKCASSFNKKLRARCYYYLGLDNFYRTGNRKNKFIKNAKGRDPKAKEFYKGKI